MSALTKVLTGAAGLAAVVGFASPAAAQYYPSPYGYGNQGNVLGTILNGVLGGGGYGQGNYGYGQGNDRYAVDACARTVEARLNNRGGYGNYGSGYGGSYGGYNNYGYGSGYGNARVQGITQVERKSYGLKVRGVASSGANSGYGGYGGYGYNNGYAQADLNFSCKVDRSGRVIETNFERINNRYRGY